MSQNFKHGSGFGLESPGQFYNNPQTITELEGPDWRESYIGPRVDPGVLLGHEQGRVAVPDALLSYEHNPALDRDQRDGTNKSIMGGPEIELLTSFQGQGPAPDLPADPSRWRDDDWNQYFNWVSTDPHAFRALVHTWDAWRRRRNTF